MNQRITEYYYYDIMYISVHHVYTCCTFLHTYISHVIIRQRLVIIVSHPVIKSEKIKRPTETKGSQKWYLIIQQRKHWFELTTLQRRTTRDARWWRSRGGSKIRGFIILTAHWNGIGGDEIHSEAPRSRRRNEMEEGTVVFCTGVVPFSSPSSRQTLFLFILSVFLTRSVFP